jgi:hypothetical protein
LQCSSLIADKSGSILKECEIYPEPVKHVVRQEMLALVSAVARLGPSYADQFILESEDDDLIFEAIATVLREEKDPGLQARSLNAVGNLCRFSPRAYPHISRYSFFLRGFFFFLFFSFVNWLLKILLSIFFLPTSELAFPD